jgi:hypothetical protein
LSRFERPVGPFVVAVDESLCIVLRGRDGQTYTITNVDALKAALDDARTFRDVLEAEVERRRAVATAPVPATTSRSDMTTRYAAQAVTVDGYGDIAIVVQPVGEEPNDWPTGAPVAEIPIDGDFTSAADLDHALAGRDLRRVTEWEPAPFGSVATVVEEGP